jgi:ACT domain-containing protein
MKYGIIIRQYVQFFSAVLPSLIIGKDCFAADFRRYSMRAVITVIGKDTVGILHKVSGICAKHSANVVEVTQSVLQDMFAMIMLVDISGMGENFASLTDDMSALGKEQGLAIHCMHEDIFNSMHKI